jgi:serine/threonine protein kinase
MKQLTSGLAYLHAKGVRHYHLSPKHILLDDGMVPKISGLIKESLRHSGIGSPEEFFILAPEQVRPERYGNKGRRTDLYQLGAIWYWLVTGALPERNDEFVPDISDDLADEIGCLNLMKRLLTPEKRHRFRSADEFLQLFDDICTLPEQPDGEDPEA